MPLATAYFPNVRLEASEREVALLSLSSQGDKPSLTEFVSKYFCVCVSNVMGGKKSVRPKGREPNIPNLIQPSKISTTSNSRRPQGHGDEC